MSKITILLQKMKSLCDSNNGKDTFNSPVTAKEYLIGRLRIT